MNFLLAVDPGGMTGYCWVGIPEDSQPHLIESGQLLPEPFCDLADTYLTNFGNAETVVERYTITARTISKSRQTDALEITGVLKFLARRLTGQPIILQTPAEALRLLPDSRLRDLGWWVAGDHARDATRHALYRLLRTGRMSLPRKL